MCECRHGCRASRPRRPPPMLDPGVRTEDRHDFLPELTVALLGQPGRSENGDGPATPEVGDVALRGLARAVHPLEQIDQQLQLLGYLLRDGLHVHEGDEPVQVALPQQHRVAQLAGQPPKELLGKVT